MLLGEQQFGGVAHLSQTVGPHLVDTHLGGAAEAILDATQDAVHIVLVALKLQHGVDDMLQYLRSGQRSLFVDMADQYHGGAARLGKPEQGSRTFAHLGDAACRRLGRLGADGLYRVDDDELGFLFLDMGEDALERCLTEYQQVVVGSSDALGTHLQLAGALLAADVENPAVGECQHRLQRQRALADARLATEQHKAPLDQSASQHTVELLVVHVDAALFVGGYVLQPSCLRGPSCLPHCTGSGTCCHLPRLVGDAYLLEGVPLSAGWTLANPLGRLLSAVVANVSYLVFCHSS